MKKLFVLFSILFVAVILSGCKTDQYEIALITDVGTIDDGSFNQGAWEGVVKYAEENDISHKYYQPKAKTDKDYEDAIDLAVEGGAEVIVTPGYYFAPAITAKQTEYPEVTFIFIDGVPDDIKDNVYSILFQEEQSGFLAGYAAVKEGFTELGFMGGDAVPAVIRFGYGYLQGANVAAEEMDLDDDAITVKYNYLSSFGPSPAIKTKAASWFSGGTEVIFAAAGGAGDSVMAAAEDTAGDNYVIGVDIDQAVDSDTVITSAKKELKNSVYQALQAYYNDDDSVLKAGEVNTLGITNDGVGLPTDFSRFPDENFTLDDYNALVTALKEDTDGIRTNIVGDHTIDVNTLVIPKINLIVEE